MHSSRLLPILLVLPALALVLALFVYPLFYSLISAFAAKDGAATLNNFAKAFELYTTDIVFTAVIVGVSTILIGACAAAIGGYLILGENPRAVAALKFLYRWTPFVALLVAGAMAALDRAMIEAARNLGASRPRILVEIVLPQVSGTMIVGLILSFVTMLSVLSVPIMVSGGSPTMMTVDMAFRINSYSDYGTANALGFISYAITGIAAWIYLRRSVASGGKL